MRNPWLKGNPVLSMFMSTANIWLGIVRGHAGQSFQSLRDRSKDRHSD
jgi:hypothetical protein